MAEKTLKGSRVLIIGDVMIDHYITGDVSRISPEAPVPVVKAEEEFERLGGAANVAANISALGGEAILISVVGEDEGKEKLKELMRTQGIKSYTIIDEHRPTTMKSRILGRNQQLLRIDYETKEDINRACEDAIIKLIKEIDVDAIALSDYNKGVLTPRLVTEIISYANEHGIKTILDPKPHIIKHCNNIYLIKPNNLEACNYAGVPVQNGEQVLDIGQKMSDELNSHVLITRGEKGMSLFEKGKKAQIIETQARHVYDVTGAGDTVTAVLALGLASGYELESAVRLANTAAGIVVGKTGTDTLSPEELFGDEQK